MNKIMDKAINFVEKYTALKILVSIVVVIFLVIFVMVFFLPLLIIGVAYNLIMEHYCD